MNDSSTHLDLLRYVYNEMPAREHTLFEMRLKQDPDLQIQCDKIKELIADLSKIEVNPSQTSIDIVMEHAKTQHPELQ